MVFKVLGVLLLIISAVPARIKEWAYAGFGFAFTFAAISHASDDAINGQTFFPLVVFAVLAVSYVFSHKLNAKS